MKNKNSLPHPYVSHYDYNEVTCKSTLEEKKYDSFSTFINLKTKRKIIIDNKLEEEKIYNAEPSVYTDTNYTPLNLFREFLYYKNQNGTLKTIIRNINKLSYFPSNMYFILHKRYYYPRIGQAQKYKLKVKNNGKNIRPSFEINDPRYSKELETKCSWGADKLIKRLREEGFIVQVNDVNPSYISSMIRTASLLTNKKVDIPIDKEEETPSIIAYGYGKKIGFTCNKDTMYGYSAGIDNIIWERCGFFDKWSNSQNIPKTTDIEEIISVLKTDNEEFDY